MHGSSSRQIIFETAIEHFETLYNTIQYLIDLEKEIDLIITIKLKGCSVDLKY